MHPDSQKIVVLDGHTLNPGDNPWDELAALGDLAVYPRTPPEEIVARASGATVVLTNKTPLTRPTLEQLPALRCIAVLATGYDVVDVAAARERGIVVSNVPEYGTDSVAQLVFALLLELCHHVGRHDRAVRGGAWQRCADFSFWQTPQIELAGLRLGIVGYGRIGRRVAALGRCFAMELLVHTRSPRSEAGVRWCSREQLFSEADVVSLHCPLTPETAGFVDRGLLQTMQSPAFLINTARGGLVDEEALAQALSDNVLAGAAVDVVSAEPISADNPLLRTDNCIITPHFAWASLQSRRRLMSSSAANVRAFLAGSPIHVVSV